MSEYNLTIMDIDWENYNQYDIKIYDRSLIRATVVSGDLRLLEDGKPEGYVLDHYALEDILKARFKKVVDWSGVKVDTRILVKDDKIRSWRKKHFAKYENGIVYSWIGNGTSWNEKDIDPWLYAELETEED